MNSLLQCIERCAEPIFFFFFIFTANLYYFSVSEFEKRELLNDILEVESIAKIALEKISLQVWDIYELANGLMSGQVMLSRNHEV